MTGKGIENFTPRASTRGIPLLTKVEGEQYVAVLGGQKDKSWITVELIDKLMVNVEKAFCDISREALKKQVR
jgi:hypothetical protein